MDNMDNNDNQSIKDNYCNKLYEKNHLIKPVYFPFTFIAPENIEFFLKIFKIFSIYQPSEIDVPNQIKKYIDEKLIEIRIPYKDITNKEKLFNILKEYRNIGVNIGQQIKHFKNIDNIPFFEETTQKIKSEILNNKNELENWEQIQIFLHIIQELDIHNYELTNQLEAFDRKNHNLIAKILNGSDNRILDNELDNELFNEPELKIKEDRGSQKPKQRFNAWADLFVKDNSDTGLLITDSEQIFEFVCEYIDDFIELLKIPLNDDLLNELKNSNIIIKDFINNIILYGPNKSNLEILDKIKNTIQKYNNFDGNFITFYAAYELSPNDLIKRISNKEKASQGIHNTLISVLN